MEFLVELDTALPPDMPVHDREDLLDREAARGRELRQAGVVRSIWRVPGRLANIGIWSADDADQLHEYLTSLPLWPWMNVTVTTLAKHPLMNQ